MAVSCSSRWLQRGLRSKNFIQFFLRRQLHQVHKKGFNRGCPCCLPTWRQPCEGLGICCDKDCLPCCRRLSPQPRSTERLWPHSRLSQGHYRIRGHCSGDWSSGGNRRSRDGRAGRRSGVRRPTPWSAAWALASCATSIVTGLNSTGLEGCSSRPGLIFPLPDWFDIHNRTNDDVLQFGSGLAHQERISYGEMI